jgi:hypothetical protein
LLFPPAAENRHAGLTTMMIKKTSMMIMPIMPIMSTPKLSVPMINLPPMLTVRCSY